jgi:translation initiation factor IF-1
VHYGNVKKMELAHKKDCSIEMQGVVTQSLGNGLFKVELDNGLDIIAHVSGKIRRNFIKILLADRVIIQLSTYDLAKGRIIYRFRSKQIAPKTNV